MKIIVRIGSHVAAEAENPDDERATALADFIQSDIQGSLATAESWINELSRVEHGEVATSEGTGNAYTISIFKDRVEIQNEIFYENPPFEYTHNEVRDALETLKKSVLEYKSHKV